MLAKNRKYKREKNQALLFSIFIAILTLGMISFLIISDYRINKKRVELSEQIKKYQKDIQELEERNAQLKAGITQTQQESYWEEKAREQGYKKPGEEQVVVVPPAEKTGQKSEGSQNFWQKILNIFNSRD
ncbi:MAG: septum formation initiator family protein [bacterium]